MFGPVMAIAWPIASFITALWAAVLTIASNSRDEPAVVAVPDPPPAPAGPHLHVHQEQADELDVVEKGPLGGGVAWLETAMDPPQ